MTQRKTISEGYVSHSAQPSPRAVEKVQLTCSFGALSHHIAAPRTPIGHVHNVDNLTRAQPKHKNMINWDRASTLCATRNFQEWVCKNFNECRCIRQKERSRDKEKTYIACGRKRPIVRQRKGQDSSRSRRTKGFNGQTHHSRRSSC